MDNGSFLDTELLYLIQHGSESEREKGFNELYARYNQEAMRVIQHICPEFDQPSVEEICQQVWVVVANKINQYKATTKPINFWINSIARRVALAYRRQYYAQREKNLYVSGIYSRDSQNEASLEDRYIEYETRRGLYEQIANLPPLTRAVLEGKAQGRSYEELAKQLDAPIENIYQRASWGKKLLKSVLAPVIALGLFVSYSIEKSRAAVGGTPDIGFSLNSLVSIRPPIALLTAFFFGSGSFVSLIISAILLFMMCPLLAPFSHVAGSNATQTPIKISKIEPFRSTPTALETVTYKPSTSADSPATVDAVAYVVPTAIEPVETITVIRLNSPLPATATSTPGYVITATRPATAKEPPEVTSTPTPTATFIPTPLPDIAASVAFWADRSEIDMGKCVTIYWLVEHVREIYFEGDPVTGQGQKGECPTDDTDYRLTIIMKDYTVQERYLTIQVTSRPDPHPTSETAEEATAVPTPIEIQPTSTDTPIPDMPAPITPTSTPTPAATSTVPAPVACGKYATVIYQMIGVEDAENSLCAPDGVVAQIGELPHSELILDMGTGNKIIDQKGGDFIVFEYPNGSGILLDRMKIQVAQDDGEGHPAQFITVFVWGDDDPSNNGLIPSKYLPEEQHQEIEAQDLYGNTGIAIDIGKDDFEEYRFVRITTHPESEAKSWDDRPQIDAIQILSTDATAFVYVLPPSETPGANCNQGTEEHCTTSPTLIPIVPSSG